VRLAVLSDIHSVSSVLGTALGDARAEGFDILLILGDLLTYGVRPRETLELVHEAVARDGAILVAGNHDQMYLDTAEADREYQSRLPDWLRETVEWTAAQISPGALTSFDWHEQWSSGSMLAAHANPYAFGDWSYIADAAGAEAAADALLRCGYRYGVFGHTHRARRFESNGAMVFTIGSLGQPRDDADSRMQWAMIDLQDDSIDVQPRFVPFDRARHRAAICATTLSGPTQDRLCEFFA
jgi:predicted phosphodiesterase